MEPVVARVRNMAFPGTDFAPQRPCYECERNAAMKFGDFLFPESSDPACDGEIIDDALAEARLCDELGMDAIWLAEHHFDGNCAYVDPLTFAAALAVATKRAELGFAVLQT